MPLVTILKSWYTKIKKKKNAVGIDIQEGTRWESD